MLEARPDLPWASEVVATDAPPDGFGVVAAELPVVEVAACDRLAEWWRFDVEEAVSARSLALGLARPLVKGGKPPWKHSK